MNLDAIKEFFSDGSFIKVVIAIVVILLIWVILDRLVTHAIKKLESGDSDFASRSASSMRSLRRFFRYAVVIIGVLVVLQIFGINVSSLIAGLGIASVLIGLALQDAFKDIIMGVNITIDGYYKPGDHIRYDDRYAVVIEAGLKTTKLKDELSGEILVIPNRNISQAIKTSPEFDLIIPVRHEEKHERVMEVMTAACEDIMQLDSIEAADVRGLKSLDVESAKYLIHVTTAEPETIHKAKFDSLALIKTRMEKENLEIPYGYPIWQRPENVSESREKE